MSGIMYNVWEITVKMLTYQERCQEDKWTVIEVVKGFVAAAQAHIKLMILTERGEKSDSSLILVHLQIRHNQRCGCCSLHLLNLTATAEERPPESWKYITNSEGQTVISVIVLEFVDMWIWVLIKLLIACSPQLSVIYFWVSIKTAEPAAQTAALQSELWLWFDGAESAGCAKTHGLFSSRVLPQRSYTEEVQPRCVVTSPHKPDLPFNPAAGSGGHTHRSMCLFFFSD